MDNNGKVEGIYIGEIMSAHDPDMNGRLKVYIPALQKRKSENKTENTFNCIMTSPFAGSSSYFHEDVNSVTEGVGSSKSYGIWMTPPDPGTQVIVAFGMGNLKYGLVLSCLYPEDRTYMIPGLAGSPFNYTKPGFKLPVTEKNRFDKSDGGKGTSALRPAHLGFTKTLYEQGLIGDDIRGASSSTSRRESPSKVFGILTPGSPPTGADGPIRPSNKSAGHQFVMDDGDNNGKSKNIRIRTGGGNQILMDDTDGIIYFINKSGKAWMELDQAGGITIFGEGSVDIRSKGNFNLRADRNINIEAGGDINMKAAGDTASGDGDQYVGTSDLPIPVPLGYGGNIRFESAAQTSIFSTQSTQLTSLFGDVDISSAGRTALTGGTLGVDVVAGTGGIKMLSQVGGIHLNSSLGINLTSTAPVSLAGSLVLLNSPGGIPSLPALPALTASPMSMNKHDDWSSSPPDFGDDELGDDTSLMPDMSPENASGRKKGPTMKSIVSTMPTAEPYMNHAKSDALAHSQATMSEEDFDDNLGPSDSDSPDGYTGG